MKDISISITTESLNLLEKQTEIINKRELIKSKIDTYWLVDGNASNAQNIPEDDFKNINGALEIIKESNSAISKISSIKNEIKELEDQEKQLEKKIKSLKSNSTLLVWVILFVGLVISIFLFKND